MIIEKINISNFKRVSAISVELSDITYLVGGNNSGKSSVLQAVHMAVSCAQRSAELQQQVIAEFSLRYCPTGDFQQLGNSGPYENRKDGSRGVIEFSGKTTDGADASYKIEIYKARNYHNVGVDRTGVYPGFGQFICDYSNLFSVYVPGLAGIPHNEEMRSYASVFLKAAGGEANLVFRNIIRLLHDENKLGELEALLFDIIGPCKFLVKFNNETDLYVDVKISFQDPPEDHTFVPMDLSGTGVIQITQILAYVILFKPKILLVDEPDSHLHPSRQSLLSAAFSKIVANYGCKIVVSTHSRHLVSSAPQGTKLVWLREGNVEVLDDDKGLTAILLDLGALDQIDSSGADIIICTEDKGKQFIEYCISQINLDVTVKVIAYNGVNNAASAAVIQSMAELFPNSPKIVVHRDRDFLTQAEIRKWGREYHNRGITVFSPTLPDIESYYINAAHVASIYEISPSDAQTELARILDELTPEMRSKFRHKRQEAIRTFWRDGGGPVSDTLWPSDRAISPKTTLGKEVVPRINEEFSKKFGVRRFLFAQASADLVEELRVFFDDLG